MQLITATFLDIGDGDLVVLGPYSKKLFPCYYADTIKSKLALGSGDILTLQRGGRGTKRLRGVLSGASDRPGN